MESLYPYNIYMKNTKAIFLILLGTFLLATGFAVAGSFEQLSGNPFGDGRSASISPAGNSAGTVSMRAAVTPPAPAPAPAKPGLGETIKNFWVDNSRNILLGGIGAYAGFALFGPVGLVLGALFFLGLGMV